MMDAIYGAIGNENDQGVDPEFLNREIGLRRIDHGKMDGDRINELVSAFKSNILERDNIATAKFSVNSRNILYRQIAAAYAFGVAVWGNIHTQDALVNVLTDKGLTQSAANLSLGLRGGDQARKLNHWNSITLLLYADAVFKDETATDSPLVLKRPRSAEKYANVLRLMGDNGVKIHEAVAYIENFNDPEFGAGLLGMEKRDRKNHPSSKSNPKGVSKKTLDMQAECIRRGEDFSHDDVFEITKPNQIPEAVEYGCAYFRIDGSNMVIVGYDVWEHNKYEKHVIGRGKDMIDEENRVKANAETLRKAAEADANDLTQSLMGDPDIKQLLAAGISVEDIKAKIKGAVGQLVVVQKNTIALEQIADLEVNPFLNDA